MKYFVCLVFILIGFCQTGFSQPNATLIGQYTPATEDPDGLYHEIENAADKFTKDPNAFFAMRVCSANPLPIAFANALGVKFAVKIVNQHIEYFKKTLAVKIPDSKIYFLRNDKGCKLISQPNTEFWFVPSNADFPAFVEIENYDNLTVHNFTYWFEEVNDGMLLSPPLPSPTGSLLTPELYEKVKSNIYQTLRNKKTAYLQIEIPRYGKKTQIAKIKVQAGKLKTFLTGNGIGSHRIFVRTIEDATNSERDIYPDVTIIYQEKIN